MNRVENVSRFVAALASNPIHSNETVPNIIDMAEELADEVETRYGLTAQQKEDMNCTMQDVIEEAKVRKAQRELDEAFAFMDSLSTAPKQKPLLLRIIQGITFGLCIIVVAGLLIYGFTNACRWVWNFYS